MASRQVMVGPGSHPREGDELLDEAAQRRQEANIAWKASRSTARTLVADTARTVAERATSLTSAISPKHSPRARRTGASPRPGTVLTTSASPPVTT